MISALKTDMRTVTPVRTAMIVRVAYLSRVCLIPSFLQSRNEKISSLICRSATFRNSRASTTESANPGGPQT